MIHKDERGYFKEIIRADIKQINQSFSKKGVVRGLHYQNPELTKYVWVAKGRIYDVRFNLETGEYDGEVLTPDDGWFKIPKGYAHGFQALEDSVICYAMDGVYNPDGDKVVNPSAVTWPIKEQTISEKDKGSESWKS